MEFRKDTEYNDRLRKKYWDLLDYGNAHPKELQQNLEALRQLVLLEGLPSESEEEVANRLEGNVNFCSLRGLVWKILLNVRDVDATKYVTLVRKPSDETYQKIRKDVSRTFMNNTNFAKSVSQDKLCRCLCAVANYCLETGGHIRDVSYVQGMNTLCGGFLYVLPEVDAFYAFISYIKSNYLYVVKGIPGIYTSVELLDHLLLIVDPELHKYFLAHPPYGPEMLTQFTISLASCTPPLDEALRLWDFYFAFGVHMNVVCTVAQLVLMRDALLAHPTPALLFQGRSMPPLQAENMIALAVQLVRQLPSKLYDMLVQHPVTSIQIPK